MTTLASSSPSPQIELSDLVTGPENELFIDSRIVASRLDVNHSAWMTNIVKKYQTQVEQEFGILHFENGEIKGKGQPEKFVYLTEDQAISLLTLSRNSQVVVQCKFNLVKAFSQARKDLESRNKPQETIKLPTDFVESLELLLAAEKEKKALASANEELQAATAKLQATNSVLVPKAEAADILLEVGGNKTLQEAAQLLSIPGLGRTNFIKALKELKYLTNDGLPYQKYLNQGIFAVIEKSSSYGAYTQVLVTQKGLQHLIKVLAEYGKKSSKVADSFRPTPKAI